MNVNHFYGDNDHAVHRLNQPHWDYDTEEWFHGITSRKDAEALLMCQPPGCFLVRAGESRSGFTLSYRATDRCRHFMVDLLRDGNYAITGEATRHRSLHDLVDFHRRAPIMPFNDLLTVPCVKASEGSESDEEVPPALPYRSALPSIPGSSTPPCHSDPAPKAFSNLLPDPAPHFESRLQPLVKAVDPAAWPGHTDIYDNTQASPERDAGVLLYPTLPSALPPSGTTPSGLGAPQDQRADPSPSVVVGQMKLMALFRKKWGASQESPAAETHASGGARPGDEGLPEEYLQPPPYAPGYC